MNDNDIVRRTDIINRLLDRSKPLRGLIHVNEVIRTINVAPSVNPQPKTGHWINVNDGKWNTIPAYKCSACGANADLRDWSGKSPFCPNCGARMVEPQESEVQED